MKTVFSTTDESIRIEVDAAGHNRSLILLMTTVTLDSRFIFDLMFLV
jgi:hypothetical protein